MANGRCSGFNINSEYYDSKTERHYNRVSIDSLLDVGAGDGRVFCAIKDIDENNLFAIAESYGIEKARAQSDDLIRRGVFIIGRDFFQTTLIDKKYSVIFSNPPYSIYEEWTLRLLRESSFGLMYLVLPVRWEGNKEILRELKRFDYKNIGEYDFIHGDRAARARVNLIRINNKIVKGEGYKEYIEPDPFTRWIEENIGKFDCMPETEIYKYEEEERFLKVKKDSTIDDLVDDYAAEMNSLITGFKSVVHLPENVVKAIGLNKESFLKIIKDNIQTLKTRYWRLAFEKLEAITDRLTYDMRYNLIGKMDKFNTLDFNAGNIRSIVIWIIEHYNKYTKKQTIDLFNKLTEPDYIKAYKSNTHWDKDTWRYSAKYPDGRPEKYILDYRFVARARHGCYGYNKKLSIVNDLIVVLRSLGADIPSGVCVDANENQKLQGVIFYDHKKNKHETAFECRFYQNGNVHLKVNKELMTKFNVEVARILGWVRSPKDIQDEFEMSEEEAVNYWQTPALKMIGTGDIKMLECKEAV